MDETAEVSARLLVLVGAVVAVVAALGLATPAGPDQQVTADEPQYLLTAGALFDRQDLDIGPDLRARTWEAYHRRELPRQTRWLPDGQRLSPHDPGLPLLLALPVGLGGWVGAKVFLSLVAGALAVVLTWTAVVRLRVPEHVAALAAGGFGVVPPLVAYGSQVYPELPAGLAVAVAAAALLGPPSRRSTAVWVAGVIALPWLAVKYAPVAAALALVGLARLAAPIGHRRPAGRPSRVALGAGLALALAGVVYLLVHQRVYGGWTVYAVGSHFGEGEMTVVGSEPNPLGRSVRLFGLLTDRDFGLVAWAPAWLALVPAVAGLVRRRPPGWLVLTVPLAAGWLNATFVALTMHGWWWPGRQVVVVLPLGVLAVAWWLGTVVGWARARAPFLVATAFGLGCWAWLQVECLVGDRTLIVDFAQTSNPLSKAWRLLLPDLRAGEPLDGLRATVWTSALVALAVVSWRTSGPTPRGLGRVRDQDPGAGEGTDTDVAAVDLHRGGAVG